MNNEENQKILDLAEKTVREDLEKAKKIAGDVLGDTTAAVVIAIYDRYAERVGNTAQLSMISQLQSKIQGSPLFDAMHPKKDAS